MHYYKVRSVNGTLVSDYSNVVSVKAVTPLAAPEVTISRNTNGKPVLSWAAVEGAAKYEVWRSTSETGTYTRLSTTTGLKLTNSSAAAGPVYHYKAGANNADTESVYSKNGTRKAN